MWQQACQLGVQVRAGERGQADGLQQPRELQLERSKFCSARLLSMTALCPGS